ncbi:MAG: ketopantoate reductase family protein [Propionibacteriaceae bacterium]
MTRYIIVGAGAVGGGIAGLLAESGASVVAVARGEHAEVISRDGLTIRTPERAFTVRLPCVTDPAQLTLAPTDVLVLATKTHQAEVALRQWADVWVHDGDARVARAGERLPIMTALNGVSAEDMALRYFARVLGVCVWMPAVHLEPGEVIVRGTPTRGMFHVGPYPARDSVDDHVGGHEREVLDAVDRDWTTAGFVISRPQDVMPWKYRKLISNIGNAFDALVGDNGRPGPMIKLAQAEARVVLAAAKIAVIDEATESAARAGSFDVASVPGEPTRLGGSSWQSLTRSTGTIETDYLNGEIARIAHLVGISAPVNTTIAALAREAAAAGRQPGDLSATDVAERLGLDPDVLGADGST